MSEENQIRIYVFLLDEAVDVWRPVQAIEKVQGLYQIVSESLAPDDVKGEFTTGDIVRVNKKSFSDSRRELVAVEKVDISLKNSEC